MFKYFALIMLLTNIAATGLNVFRALEKPMIVNRQTSAKCFAFAAVFALFAFALIPIVALLFA